MAHYTVRDIQTQLKKLGFNPGEIDGIYGRRTRAAVKAFQASRPGLEVDGAVGSITLGKLFNKTAQEVADSKPSRVLMTPWLDIALSKKGLHEDLDNEELRKFLKSDGDTLGDPAKLPWCGDFVETCLALTLPNENLPGNPYLARNWAKWGVDVNPMLGAVGSFWRGSKTGTAGHVGFIVGKGKDVYYLLGGNQNNRVSIAPIAMDRLLEARWPKTFKQPKKTILPTMEGGKLSLNEA